MTPQSSFMVVAQIEPGKLGALRDLLRSMNAKPGVADPENTIVPFGHFDKLHFARIVILDDQTLGDGALYGLPTPVYPLWLAFLGDIDGEYEEFLAELDRRAGPGLRRIFSHCTGFDPKADLRRWMREREHRPSTFYFNWRGRTVVQCREEEALRKALAAELQRAPELARLPAPDLRKKLLEFVGEQRAEGRIELTPEAATPLGWMVRNALHFVLGTVAVGLALLLVVLCSPVLIFMLRRREKRDPVIAPRPDKEWVTRLSTIEDYGVTNQFSAMGSLKPGLFRKWTLLFVLWVIEYTARHWFVKGRLARVHTIHSARWVYIDGGKRLYFASNYDGSLESYMDDFINKVAFGLNVVFSNGIGYPRTNWLILDGAKDEQSFKYFIRRHELPTEVWYDAQAGLTNSELQRNSQIRRGIEAGSMTDEELRAWVALL
jgi:hypothetical protein